MLGLCPSIGLIPPMLQPLFVSHTVVLILKCLMQTSRRELAESFVTWFSFSETTVPGKHRFLIHLSDLLVPQP